MSFSKSGIEYTYEKIEGEQEWDVRLKGEFIGTTETKNNDDYFDKELEKQGFESRRHAFEEFVKQSLRYIEPEHPELVERFTEVGRKKVEEIIRIIRDHGLPASIEVVWKDAGAGTKWESIITKSRSKYSTGMKFQLLNPVEFDRMNDGTITEGAVREILSRVHIFLK
jgi:hypothetical protein